MQARQDVNVASLASPYKRGSAQSVREAAEPKSPDNKDLLDIDARLEVECLDSPAERDSNKNYEFDDPIASSEERQVISDILTAKEIKHLKNVAKTQ